MRAEIKSLLAGGEKGYWDVVEGMTEGTEQQRRDLIRALLDQKVLERAGTTRLRWRA